MTNTVLLNKIIQERGLKKVFLAEKAGMSAVTLHNCITGKTEFKASQIAVLCDILGIKDLALKEAVFFADGVASQATN